MDKHVALNTLAQIFETSGACGLSSSDVVENEMGDAAREGVFYTSTIRDGTELLNGWAVAEGDMYEAVPVLRLSELDAITWSQVDPGEEDSLDIFFELSSGKYRIHYNHTKLECDEVSTSFEVLLRSSKRWVHGGVAIQLMRELAEEGPRKLLTAMDGLVERCLRDKAPAGDAMVVLEKCLRREASEGSVFAASQYVLTTLLCGEASGVFDINLALTMLEEDKVLHCARESLVDHYHLNWSPDDISTATADLEAAALSHSLGESYQMSPLWGEPSLERFRRAELFWRSLHETVEDDCLL